MFTFSAIVSKPATEPGAVSGFSCKCSCGATLRNTGEMGLAHEMKAHADWHNSKKGK